MPVRYHFSFVVVFALLVSSLAGCGSSADRVTKKQIDLMNQMAAALENDASEATMTSIQNQMKNNRERFEALDLTQEEAQALAKKYEEPLMAAMQRLISAMMQNPRKGLQGTQGFPGFPGFPGSGTQPGPGSFPNFGR